jgi:hypothetical protein
MIVGFDFDNTIINYTNSFKKLCQKKNLVPNNIKKNKNSIRNYLRKKNIENEWTVLQGEVYGKYIMNAEIYKGVLKAILYLSKKNFEVKIISHKTKYPYIGEKINLRLLAMKWLAKNLLKRTDIRIDKKNIFFEDTIENKIKRIKEERCDIYIDDLPEVLSLLPSKTKKILFSPTYDTKHYSKLIIMKSWKDFPKILKIKNE